MTTNAAELNVKMIVDKQFKNSMRGYNQEDVDAYLDIIIKDYQFYESEIKRLEKENKRLKKNASQSPARTVPNQNQSNYDVLKRLSNLEKAVFGPRLNER